jgi:hypothetical protein
MIIIPPPLHNTQHSRIGKGLYFRLIPLLKHKLMIEMPQLMRIQIQDSYLILFTLKYHHLILT